MMLKDEEKTVVNTFLQDNNLFFAYDIRENVTNLDKFLSPGYDIDIFKLDTKVTVVIQVCTRKFKRKRDKACSFKYLFQLVRIYKLKDVKLSIVLISEKRQREEDV